MMKGSPCCAASLVVSEVFHLASVVEAHALRPSQRKRGRAAVELGDPFKAREVILLLLGDFSITLRYLVSSSGHVTQKCVPHVDVGAALDIAAFHLARRYVVMQHYVHTSACCASLDVKYPCRR